MPPTDTKTRQDPTLQPTIPAQEANIPPRDLDPDMGRAPGSIPTEMPQGDNTAASRHGRAQDEARRAKDEASEEARRRYEQTRQFTNEALDKAKQQWNQTRGQAGERAGEMARQQKSRIAQKTDDVARAARAAADALDERQDAAVAGYARTAAQQLEHARDYLNAAEPRDLMDEARRFTRRNPEWVLGGMFVAGLAAARFLKSDRHVTSRRRRPEGADPSLYGDIYRSQYEEEYESGYRPSPIPPAGVAGYKANVANPPDEPQGFGPESPVSLENPAGHTQEELPGPTPSESRNVH